jgi:hypothetical protein
MQSFGSFLPKKAAPPHHGRVYTYARNAVEAGAADNNIHGINWKSDVECPSLAIDSNFLIKFVQEQ